MFLAVNSETYKIFKFNYKKIMSVIVKCKKQKKSCTNQRKNKQLICECPNEVTYCTTPLPSCLPRQPGPFITYSTALSPCTMIQGNIVWNGVKQISCISLPPCSSIYCCSQTNCEPY